MRDTNLFRRNARHELLWRSYLIAVITTLGGVHLHLQHNRGNRLRLSQQETRAAVEKFQRWAGLDIDGIVGPLTAAALRAVVAGGPTDESESDSPGTDSEPDAEEDLGPAAGDVPSRAGTFPEDFDNWAGELARRFRRDVYVHKPSGK